MPGNQQAFTQWYAGDPQSQPSGIVPMGPTPMFRDAKDRLLASYAATPEAIHPDGYLGTAATSTRRSDKLYNAATNHNKPYQRGVHKGEKINARDYFWSQDLNVHSGLINQAMGRRWAPVGAEPVRLTNDGKVGPRGVPGETQVEMDANRRAMLKQQLPSWR